MKLSIILQKHLSNNMNINEEEEKDPTGAALIALNHLSIIADDLYSAMGDAEDEVTSEDSLTILNCYEMLSDIYQRYDAEYVLSSEDDDDNIDVGDDDDIDESDNTTAAATEFFSNNTLISNITYYPKEEKLKVTKGNYEKFPFFFKMDKATYDDFMDNENKKRWLNQKIKNKSLMLMKEENLNEGFAWKQTVKTLDSLGFKKTKPGANTYKSNNEISHLFGIPMRANKWADIFFVIFTEGKEYGIVSEDGIVDRYDNLDVAIKALKVKMKVLPTKKNESFDFAQFTLCELREAKKEVRNRLAIHKWDMSNTKDGFRFELVGTNAIDVAKLVNKFLPNVKYKVYNKDLGFNSLEDRDFAVDAVVRYYKAIKDKNINEMYLTESFDTAKFRRLSSTGLIPKEDLESVTRAMKNLDAGKEITRKQKDLISSVFLTLIELVTGDANLFSKIRARAKEDSSTTTNEE